MVMSSLFALDGFGALSLSPSRRTTPFASLELMPPPEPPPPPDPPQPPDPTDSLPEQICSSLVASSSCSYLPSTALCSLYCQILSQVCVVARSECLSLRYAYASSLLFPQFSMSCWSVRARMENGLTGYFRWDSESCNSNPFFWKSVNVFGMVLDGFLNLWNHINCDFGLPCIEDFVRQVLTLYVAKGLVPFFSIGIYDYVGVVWEVQSLFRASLPHLGTCCQFLFPKFPLVWSGLDDQVSPVLQGSSSRLMVSSALVAELVALWVALDAVTHEAFGIVFFRSLLVFLLELYFQSISSLTFFRWTFKLLLLCYLVIPTHVDVFPPLLIEFEA